MADTVADIMSKKRELETCLDGLPGLSVRIDRRAFHALGRFFSLVYHLPVAGPALLNGIARFSSFVLVKGRVLGLKADLDGDPVRIVSDWMKFPALMRVPCEVAEANDERVVLQWPECPIGYRDPAQAPLCRAVMEIDRLTVERMGGEMTVAETVLEGAPCCKFIFTRR
jgi:hypothetical protein